MFIKMGMKDELLLFFEGTKVLINDIRKQLDFIEKNIADKINFFSK